MKLFELKKNYAKYGFCKIEKFFNRNTIQKIKKYSKNIKKKQTKTKSDYEIL